MTTPPDRTILIPMKVDAFVNYTPSVNPTSDPRQRAYLAPLQRPNLDGLSIAVNVDNTTSLLQHGIFEHLPKVPYMAAADRYRKENDRSGIYVHWNLPDIYKEGYVASETAQGSLQDKLKKGGFPTGDSQATHIAAGTPIFRPVPTRWIVHRAIRASYAWTQAKIAGNDGAAAYNKPFGIGPDGALFALGQDVIRDFIIVESVCY